MYAGTGYSFDSCTVRVVQCRYQVSEFLRIQALRRSRSA
jgi:hypothetical protein